MSRYYRLFIFIMLAVFIVALPAQEVGALSKADYIKNNIDYYDPDSVGCQAAGSSDTGSNVPMKQKIQQTLFIGFDMGKFDIATVQKTILKYQPGGVFFTDVSSANASKLTKSFFDSINKKLPSPLIVSSDDEGGAINRFYDNKYSAKAMGKLSDNQVSQIGSTTGSALKNHGVNLDLAPVLDLDAHKSSNEISRDGRSFSSDPNIVASKAGAFAKGVTSTGVGVTFKHFPGLRTETTNTDDAKNTYNGSIASLNNDIAPYKTLASTSKAAVMLSNMYITAWGSDPVSINKTAVSYLRNTVKFSGAIITDDLSPLAKYSGSSMPTIIQKAYSAGVTMPLFSYSSDATMDAIISSATSSAAQGDLNTSYNDTLSFKSTLGLSSPSAPTPVSPVTPAPTAPTGGGTGLVGVYAYLLGQGLSPAQAAGGTGNISVETAGTGDPTIVQGGGHTTNPSTLTTAGHAYGLLQWDPGNRVISLMKTAGISAQPSDLSGQLQLITWHMKNTTPTGFSGFDAKYRVINDVTQATTFWVKNMEGTPNGIPERITAAKLALSTYPKTPGAVTSSCGGSSSGTTTSFDGSGLPGDYTKANIFQGHVNYQQCDTAWGNTKIAHGSTTICQSACVPFSLANIIQNFGTNIDPSKLSIESGDKGLTTAGGSSLLPVVKAFAPQYNLRYEVLPKGNVNALESALTNGAQVILGGRGSTPWISTIGHVESLWKYIPSNNTFYVSDPGHQGNSKAWPASTILAGAYNYGGSSRPDQLAIAIYKK